MARIAGIDLPKQKRGEIGLTYIYGIGRSTAQMILTKAEVDWNKKVQDWTDDEQNRIRTVINESIRPYVVSGADSYPMTRVKFTPDRWEAWVPVPASRDYIIYHFKVDSKYRRFGGEGEASQVSPEYKMQIK